MEKLLQNIPIVKIAENGSPVKGQNPSLLDYTEISPHGTHKFILLNCVKCGYIHSVKMRCGDRTCPSCRKIDYYRLMRTFRPFLKEKQRLRLITLTLINKKYLFEGDIQKIRICFSKLVRQKEYKKSLLGGLYTIEIVNKGRGFNIHIHILVEGTYCPVFSLSKSWKKLTGDSYVVDIRKAYSGLGGLKYILKYLTKAPELSGNEYIYNRVLRKIRLISAFGTWYNKIIFEKKSIVCPTCGNKKWSIRDKDNKIYTFECSEEIISYLKGKSP